jgi:RimJ/RimL family protein N-acetyltransferase
LTIVTPRLRLRAPASTDAAAIFASYAQDPAVCRYMVWTPHASVQVTQAFLAACAEAWASGSRLPYVITRRDDDTAIGMLEARPMGATIDIGYVLARAHWGRGFTPEAIRHMADLALASPALFRIQASCDVDNVASQRALEKSGFVREGRLDRCTLHPNISPEPRPCFMYARCR